VLALGPFGLGPFEAVLIVVILIAVFGIGRLPDLGGAIGRSIREFRKETRKPPESLTSSSGNDDTSAQTGRSA